MEKRFSVDWFSGNIQKFDSLLSKYKNKEDIHFLEIGSFEGRSSCYFYENFIKNSSMSTLTCVDTWEGSMEHDHSQKESIWETFNFNIREYEKEKVLVNRGMSKDVLKTLKKDSYDFIYVDGSHTTKDVLIDGVLSYDLLKVGGVMTFDDYLWKGYDNHLLNPKTGIDCFLFSFSDCLEIVENSYQVSAIKIK
jgi:predicted O-methyltransferase YrrM